MSRPVEKGNSREENRNATVVLMTVNKEFGARLIAAAMSCGPNAFNVEKERAARQGFFDQATSGLMI